MSGYQFIALFIGVSVALSLVMSGAWLAWYRTKNSGWIDTAWTFGVGAVGCIGATTPFENVTTRQIVVAVLIVLWSLRLGIHIARRTMRITDDPRYGKLAREWGVAANWQMFLLAQKQALVSMPLVLSVVLAAWNPAAGWRVQDFLAVFVLIVAIAGEGIADAQLRAFRADPAHQGRLCDVGLWSWSRHPNYFFEWLGWLAYPLFAIDLGGAYPWGWIAITAPLCMYWLLVHVSGIPPLEEHMLARRPEAFAPTRRAPTLFFRHRRGLHEGHTMGIVQTMVGVGERVPWPDPVTKAAIEFLVGRTRRHLSRASSDGDHRFAQNMAAYPIAVNVAEANTQHYEIPVEFFALILGPQRKYSCCLYDDGINTLAGAEERSLKVSAEHAALADGQRILELGCGWGSFSLWMAARYPTAQISSVSNSNSQREYIVEQARERGLSNLTVITEDMNEFRPEGRFDRVVSIEMFEHMANWRPLLRRVRKCLKPDGRMFMHVFSNKHASYRFSADDKDDWIAQHYFTGGIMPSRGLIRQFADYFVVEDEWRWNGRHYARTAEDWLTNFDRNADAIFEILTRVYGSDARLWQRRWRLFFLATRGLFGHSGGEEWDVSHYRLAPVHSGG